MRSLYLDPNTHDLAVNTAGNLRFTSSNVELVGQKIDTRLRWIRGEWFLDPNGGVPYFDSVFGKSDIDQVNAIFLAAVYGVAGVEDVIDFSTDYDPVTRSYTVRFTARATSGEIVTGEVTI